jgi:putative membrane protein
MMWNYGMGWGGWLLMALTTVGFWALVVFAIVALFRGAREVTTSSPRDSARSAEQILDERFARGEINAEEYQARQQVLRTAR